MSPIQLGVVDAYAEHNDIPWEQAATLGTLDDYRTLIRSIRSHLPEILHTSEGLRAASHAIAKAYMQEEPRGQA